MKPSLDEIATAVQMMDSDVLDTESVQRMMMFLPTPDEIAMLLVGR
jgi:hypothetical protein